jgi:hypothetical protein
MITAMLCAGFGMLYLVCGFLNLKIIAWSVDAKPDVNDPKDVQFCSAIVIFWPMAAFVMIIYAIGYAAIRWAE